LQIIVGQSLTLIENFNYQGVLAEKGYNSEESCKLLQMLGP